MAVNDDCKPVFRSALGMHFHIARAPAGSKLHLLSPGDGFKPAVCGFTPGGKWSKRPSWYVLKESALDATNRTECQKCVKWFNDNVGQK